MNDFTSHLFKGTAIIKLLYIPIKNSKMNDFTSFILLFIGIYKVCIYQSRIGK